MTSLGLSLFLIWPSVQSLHSMRNTSPGLTETTAGMSGCQRLWPTSSCSAQVFVRSILNRVFGMDSSSEVSRLVPSVTDTLD